MGALDLGTAWTRGLDVLNTVRNEDGTLSCMLGSSVTEETLSHNAEYWSPAGFASRPSSPTKGKASAQAIILKGSDVDAVIGYRDLRCQAIYGSIRPGETCIFAPGSDGNSQGRVLLKDDGSINLYTRAGNTSSGAGMVVMLNPAANSISLINGLGFGIIIDEDGVRITAGASGGGLTIGADGAVKLIATGQCQVDGGSIVLGSVAVPVANAVLRGPTGISGVPSIKVVCE